MKKRNSYETSSQREESETSSRREEESEKERKVFLFCPSTAGHEQQEWHTAPREDSRLPDLGLTKASTWADPTAPRKTTPSGVGIPPSSSGRNRRQLVEPAGQHFPSPHTATWLAIPAPARKAGGDSVCFCCALALSTPDSAGPFRNDLTVALLTQGINEAGGK